MFRQSDADFLFSPRSVFFFGKFVSRKSFYLTLIFFLCSTQEGTVHSDATDNYKNRIKRENWKLKEDKRRWLWVRRRGGAGAVWNLCFEGNEHVAFWFSTHWHLVENIYITVKLSMWPLSSLAALFSQHWELRLRSGLVGNAKAEYHLIVYSGWILPRWMKIAYMMSICTDCIS